MAIAESGTFVEGMRADTAGEDGRFEIELDEPGDYTFVILSSEHVEREVDFQVTVPAAERHALDLELPTGAIAGRVHAPQGGAPRPACSGSAARTARRSSPP